MRNYKIDYLKCICAIFVIMHHSISHLTKEYGCSFSSLFKLISSPIYAHVSIFIIIAGFFCHEQALKKYYKKKFDRILIPFFVFSLLKILYGIAISNGYAHGDSLALQLYDAFILGSLYWFSYCIFLIYCLAPLLWKGTKKNTSFPFIVLIVSICICFVNDYTGFLAKIPYFQIHHVFYYIPYFLIGYILAQNSEKLSSYFDKKRNAFLLILVFSLVYFGSYYIGKNADMKMKYIFALSQRFSVLVVIYSIVGFFRKSNIVVDKIAAYSYQLMLIDSFTRVIILKAIDKFFTISTFWMIPQTILSVIACVMICEICSKWKVTRYLLGL